jgi:hypothetical protein
VLLPHYGEAMAGGVVKLLASGAPRSVDLVGGGALGVVSAAKAAATLWSFCPPASTSSW